MKILITGFSGFVSYHLLKYLKVQYPKAEIYGLDLQKVPEYFYALGPFKFFSINLLDSQEVQKILEEIKPNWVFHLASFSSVARSWEDPSGSFNNNTNIFLNLVEGLRKTKIEARILSVGSSEQYGIVGPEDIPLTEDKPPKPANPYAVARVSQEMLSKIYVDGFGMEIILTRSFNHMGSHQSPIFFIPSIAKQIVDMKFSNEIPRKLIVGRLDIIRDFLDVRDVVKAYVSLMEKGTPGELYNVCSNAGKQLATIVDNMIKQVDFSIEIEVNPALIRPLDNPIIIGSNKKLNEATGWLPVIPLEKSLEEVLKYFLELRKGA